VSSEWIEIVVPTTVAGADDVAALLAGEIEAARAGTEIRADEVVFWAPLEHSEEVLAQTRSAVAQLATMGMAAEAAAVCARPAAPETEWRDAWKRYFHVTPITRQITIVPSWETHVPAAEEIVIDLDPGQAFGTGAHASTRLMLEALQWLKDRSAVIHRFLDVGSGSGILAIATTKLWPASSGVAIDIDPLATGAATDNCELNHVGERVACASTPVADLAERFDLVLANIQSDVLLALSRAIAGRVGPGGWLALSGLLTAQVDRVAAAYRERHGLTVESIRRSTHDPEWSSALLCRAALP
jgi:ribosomal protein L11 methyltransferase